MSFCGVVVGMAIFLYIFYYNSVFSQLLKSFCSVFPAPTKIQKNSIFHSGLFMPEIGTPGGIIFKHLGPGFSKKCFLRSIRLPDPAQRVWS